MCFAALIWNTFSWGAILLVHLDEDRSRYAHGTILSAALLLRHSLGLEEEATAVERAVDDVIAGGARTADIASPIERPLSTSELGRPVRTALGEETAVERAS